MGAKLCGCNLNPTSITSSSDTSISTIHSTPRLLPGGKTPIWRNDNIKGHQEAEAPPAISDLKISSKFVELLNIREEPIRNCYKFGNIIGLSFSTMIRDGFAIQNSWKKVSIRSIEWDSIHSDPERYLDVLRSHSEIDHPNIAGVVEFFSDEDFLYIVTEKPEGVYLKEYVSKNTLSEECVVVIAHQILEAIRCLNSKGFTRNNITINSIIIDPETLEIKLENFDLPYQFKGGKSKFIDYSSNSRITRKDIKNDLHSIGVVISKISSHKDEITMDFIRKCCTGSKSSKMTVDQALGHGFFYFRSSKRLIYGNSKEVICSLSSVHDSGCSYESSLFIF